MKGGKGGAFTLILGCGAHILSNSTPLGFSFLSYSTHILVEADYCEAHTCAQVPGNGAHTSFSCGVFTSGYKMEFAHSYVTRGFQIAELLAQYSENRCCVNNSTQSFTFTRD